MRVVWTKRALRELATIGDYIAEQNPRAAARIVRLIHKTTHDLLSSNPFIGRRGDIDGTRELVISGTPYIVAYAVSGDDIQVLFVQHGAREWPTAFSD
ncbi:type II toxin-antitoxin system RelE/ParE family toxin [Agrobacterium rubi]|uniref:type II toxin-antitoxin system RelE/ParE family toxin n=1 Tax=Agrobacterium rubi TaxID=28099 RepID=UPI001573734C|nr:type II toxin-antitoxin system RelE/ParE family toxin [Agrobacterium rubi]NTF08500.1 type II toxin-antitoxin system RelE/ParE family toxin [Agrobacterium rubi]NTF20728.1 type II toxin-antitoxin system RelE/ParE family toxin [Agrobacterium rubi]NTF27698.1 type II toxin-antitoxin system RelE/ParE family toxin [Agrobacterium rubi]